jgi:hypothetical protein
MLSLVDQLAISYFLVATRLAICYILGMKAQFVKDRLKALNKDETWLAGECGVRPRTMTNLYMRGTKPSLSVLKLMALALKCSVEDLVYEEAAKTA